jgi:HK97 family phage portal protein
MGRLSSAADAIRSYLFGAGGGNAWPSVTATDYIPIRRQESSGAGVRVDPDSALRHSAVFACLRLRANLVASTPLDVFRRVGGVQVEVEKPPLLVNPGGAVPAYTAGAVNTLIGEWLWSSQFDLDRYGNAFGVITARDGYGYPSVVELAPTGDVRVVGRGQAVSDVFIGGTKYKPRDIWHERQYTVPGSPMGLSPIMYAAWSISGYLSAQRFSLDYFGTGGIPSGVLRNTVMDEMDAKVISEAKSRFKTAVEGRDVFVTGRDWEWTAVQATGAASVFLDEMKYGVGDVARFLDVPGDMIDAESASGSITYANISQRNLQLLLTSMGPAFKRREDTFSSAIKSDRYAKFNTDALLRMDPETRSRVVNGQVLARVLAPSEARELENRPPFTPEQIAEFDLLAVPVAAAKKGA